MSTRKFRVIHIKGDVAKYYAPSATSLKIALENMGMPVDSILYIGEKDKENLPFISHKER